MKQNHILVSKVGFGLNVLLQLCYDNHAVFDILETQDLASRWQKSIQLSEISDGGLWKPGRLLYQDILCVFPPVHLWYLCCRGRVGRCLVLFAKVPHWSSSYWTFGCCSGMRRLCLWWHGWHGSVMCQWRRNKRHEWLLLYLCSCNAT